MNIVVLFLASRLRTKSKIGLIPGKYKAVGEPMLGFAWLDHPWLIRFMRVTFEL